MLIQPAVGKTVDSWCARCKLMLAHTVESIVNGKISRTHCNTCRAQHGYRPKRPGSTVARPRGGTTARPRAAKAKTAEINYAAKLDGKDLTTAKSYAPSERFQVNDLISHPNFGAGLVVAVRENNKIDVGFRDGLKTLVHRVHA